MFIMGDIGKPCCCLKFKYEDESQDLVLEVYVDVMQCKGMPLFEQQGSLS